MAHTKHLRNSARRLSPSGHNLPGVRASRKAAREWKHVQAQVAARRRARFDRYETMQECA